MNVYLITYTYGIQGTYDRTLTGLGVFNTKSDAERAINDVLQGKEHPSLTRAKNNDYYIEVPDPDNPTGAWILSDLKLNRDCFDIIELPLNPTHMELVEPVTIESYEL